MLPQRRLPAREVECRLGGSIIKNCFLEQNHDVTGSHLSPTATEQTANVAEDHDDVPQAADLLVASCAGFYIITANGIIMAVRLA